jgi:hypothetical protein
MKIFFQSLTVVCFLSLVSCGSKQGSDAFTAGCNVVWDTPGENSRASVPIGNGDIGANVWVTSGGELYVLISKTDAWSENGQLLKIGRLKMRFSEPLPVQQFRQELDLWTGTLRITGKDTDGKTFSLSVWADANAPFIRIAGESSKAVTVEVVYDGWRREPHELVGTERNNAVYGISSSKNRLITDADVVLQRDNEIAWYHRNERSIYRETLELQALSDYPDIDKDPLLHRTFGAVAYGEGFISKSPELLATAKPVRRFLINVAVETLTSGTADEWEKAVNKTIDNDKKIALKEKQAQHEKYWNDLWSDHYILVSSREDSAKVAVMTQGYQLQRYMNACAGRGNMPIKFNGSIFTVDSLDANHPFNPDYRNWGGCYWFQNTRLPYWAMLYAGDFEMMKPLFKMYMDALPLAKFRVMKYYGHGGIQFPETMYFWGTYNNNNYGVERGDLPDGVSVNTYIRYYWQGIIELTAMMLDYYDFTHDEAFLNSTLLPFANEVVTLYREHYPLRTAEGKILFTPAQSLETFHSAIQPMPEIAGLRFILPRLLKLKDSAVTRSLLEDMPEIPTAEKDGKRMIVAGYELRDLRNVENPELYAVFPYRMFGIDKPDIELVQNAYEVRTNKDARGWQQNAIQAALLGRADEAAEMVKTALNTKHTGSRFPAFWGPNYDWVPDQDHGSVQMRALQNMLIQTEGDKIMLFPAWYKKWDVRFKVHAPHNTTIEGEYINGELKNLKVTPESRAKDVIVAVSQ